MGVWEWGLMALLAVLLVAVSTATAKAYQAGPAAVVGAFDYAYLAFAALWSFVLFSEAQNSATMTGMVLIIAAGLLVLGRVQGPPAIRRGVLS